MKPPTGKLATRIRTYGETKAAYVFPGGVLFSHPCGCSEHCTRTKWTLVKDPDLAVNVTSPDTVDQRGQFTRGRLVIHNARLLLDGITSAQVYWRNASDKMRDMGITCDTITIETPRGARHRIHNLPFLSSEITPQPGSGPYAVRDVMNLEETIAQIRETGEEIDEIS